MHRLAGETIPFGHLAQRGAEDLEHCLVPLFHKSQLHKHQPHPGHVTLQARGLEIAFDLRGPEPPAAADYREPEPTCRSTQSVQS